MQPSCSTLSFVMALSLALLAAPTPGFAESVAGAPQLSTADAQAKEDYAYSVALQAYVFTFPLTMVERERKLRLHLAGPNPRQPVAPLNQIGHMRQLATAKGRLPYSPNNDTTYSGILLDLKDQPMVLHVPDMPDRYFSVEITDAYTNNLPYLLGTRVSGGKGGDILFAGPKWKGEVPAGMKLSRSPTDTTIAAVRIRVDDEADMPAVVALQDRMTLTALSDWDDGRGARRKTPAIPVQMASPEYHDDFAYFRTVADLITENPPPPEHAAALKLFEFIGLLPGHKFDPEALDEATRRGVLRAEKDGPAVLKWSTHQRGSALPSHWGIQLTGGTYGYDYLGRAEDSLSGLIQNDLDEAMYFLSYSDADGHPLVGGKRYRLHFAKGRLPATLPQGFWSLTVYDGNRFQFVDNAFNRYSLGSRSQGLKYNADGSLDLYVQPQSPGAALESNWLPSPASGPLRLNIRCYLPTPGMQRWDEMVTRIPPIEPVAD